MILTGDDPCRAMRRAEDAICGGENGSDPIRSNREAPRSR
jgi:hypothetical protein